VTTDALSSSYDGRVAALARVLQRSGVACELLLPGRAPLRFGSTRSGIGPERPEFRLIVRRTRGLRRPIDERGLGRAYVQGDLDIEVLHGDPLAVFRVRDAVSSTPSPLQVARFALELALAAPARVNARAVAYHYNLGDDFYLNFLDRRYRFYSQCLFQTGAVTLEEAAEAKLESMWEALGLRRGMHILDVGGGWGGLTEYCGARGVRVTSLTLSRESADYIERVIRRCAPGSEVLVQDLLDHQMRGRYDHAVIFGVIEHIPTYGAFCRRIWDALRPGGQLYLDASAVREKYMHSGFTRDFTWRGAHSCLALQDMLEELLFHGFEIQRVRGETHDYELTTREWARRLDERHDEITARWGENVYRRFRVYLWGCTHAFASERLQAYSVVARRRYDPGPRPGTLRRAGHFLASLR
jgi:cyclopropane-fatty-acyl-phospholipid synthase